MAQGSKSQTAAAAAPVNGVSSDHAPAPGGVNRKKQKRREKQAAKQAAEALKQNAANAKNGHPPQPKPANKPSGSPAPNYAAPELDDPEHFEPADPDDDSDEEGHDYPSPFGTNGSYQPGYANPPTATDMAKKSKKKKKSGSGTQHAHVESHVAQHQVPLPQTGSRRSNTKDRIWNTSTSEERERIKEFWLSLGEDERKSLVKIEKEAVLRKMKEQQKHSCSCTVCGRKRTAIEEELEVLYDAYYEELEQYANHQQDGTPMLPPPSRYAQTLSSKPPGRPMMTTHPPSRIHELADEESEDDEEEDADDESYSDEDDEDYGSEEEPFDLPRSTATDFFNFGNSLTVKGGILTVADDLLKNDGKKFIEMMEQLAERRMQREEEAQYNATQIHPPNMYSKTHGHNHGPPPEEEEDFDDDEEDYEDEDEYDEEEEDEEAVSSPVLRRETARFLHKAKAQLLKHQETMTEEQRMEEGRRMFQIFAARMFEQRVLTAYREKVAAERQARLLEELAEEDEKKDQHAAKKAKEAQKRKEKKEKQKAAKAEEKARKEAEKAAQDAAVKAAEEKKLEEQRKKKEEQRRKKEIERKAQEEERQRKEAERLKRQQEERERQQELERKAREQKALEKKLREEAKKKEREERENKERENREKKAQEDKERREREAKNRAEKERARKEELATAAPTPAPRKSSQPVAVALPPGLLKQNSSTGVPSPLVTPAIPKAPTPNRPRQSSQQGSHGSSPKTPQVAPGTSKSMSPAHGVPHGHQTGPPRQILTKPPTQQPLGMHHPQPSSPMPLMGPPPGMPPPASMGMPTLPPGLNGFPHGQNPMMHGMMGPRHPNMPMFPPPQPQGFPRFPPGMHAPNQLPLGRGGYPEGPPGFPQGLPGIGAANFVMGMPSHSRQASGSFDKQAVETPIVAQAQPIARPTPIQRPSSVKPHEENARPGASDVDELASHLGSKALLGDDEPEYQPPMEGRRTSIRGPGLGGANPLPFTFADGTVPPRGDAYPGFGGVSNAGTAWGTPPMGFPMGGAPAWGNSPTGALFTNPFLVGGPRQNDQPREVVLRRILCNACKDLAAQRPSADGYYDADEIYEHAQANRGHADPQFTCEELVNVCDIFGNPHNGGGSLEIKEVTPNSGRFAIKFEESGDQTAALGEIGSPLPGHSVPASGGFGAPRLFGSMSSPNF